MPAFQSIGAFLAFEVATFYEGIDEFLKEEWITLCAFDNIAAEQGQRRIIAATFSQRDVALLRQSGAAC